MTFTKSNKIFRKRMQKNTRKWKYLRVIALATGSLLWMTENTLLTNSSTFRIFSRCFSLSCVTFSTQSRRKLFLVWQRGNYRFIPFHSVQNFKYISISDTFYVNKSNGTFHKADRTQAPLGRKHLKMNSKLHTCSGEMSLFRNIWPLQPTNQKQVFQKAR